jgi:hypothetical protein
VYKTKIEIISLLNKTELNNQQKKGLGERKWRWAGG